MLKKLSALLLVVTLVVMPSFAQDDLGQTHTLTTGTRISYPDGWTVTEEDNLTILSLGNRSRVVLLDYPLVALLTNSNNPTLDVLVEIVANEVLGRSINPSNIRYQPVAGRESARLDINNPTNNVGSAVVAVRFSNDTVGMMVSLNVRDFLLEQMLESYDNADTSESVILQQETGGLEPGVYIFRGSGRFTTPAGWSFTPALRGEIEYVTLKSPDEDVTALMFELTDDVPSNTALGDVIHVADVALERVFGVVVDEASRTSVPVAGREGIQYDVTAYRRGDQYNGTLTVMRFSDNGMGMVVIYGATDAYAADIAVLVGSFNNFGARIRNLN